LICDGIATTAACPLTNAPGFGKGLHNGLNCSIATVIKAGITPKSDKGRRIKYAIETHRIGVVVIRDENNQVLIIAA